MQDLLKWVDQCMILTLHHLQYFFPTILGREIVFVVEMLLYKLFYCLCVLCIQILKESYLLRGYRIFESFFLISICGNIFFYYVGYKLITKNDNVCLFQALLTDAVAVKNSRGWFCLISLLTTSASVLCVHLRNMPDGSAEEDGFLK